LSGVFDGPEVFVAVRVVVMEVEGGDAGAEEFDGFIDGVRAGEVGVAEVEGDADVGEVADAEDLEQVFGGGDFVLKVFEEDLDAEGVGVGFEVLDGGEGVFEGAGVPELVFEAEVEGEGGEGDLLGGLEGALDLVHGIDAAGLLGVDEVEGGGDVFGPVGVGVERLVEGGLDASVAEPEGEVADDGAVGVVKVVAGGEDLDDGRAVGGDTAEHGVKEAGVEALLEEDVGREAWLHLY
jgi:hypothetical protein